jgi:hypothetical protein
MYHTTCLCLVDQKCWASSDVCISFKSFLHAIVLRNISSQAHKGFNCVQIGLVFREIIHHSKEVHRNLPTRKHPLPETRQRRHGVSVAESWLEQVRCCNTQPLRFLIHCAHTKSEVHKYAQWCSWYRFFQTFEACTNFRCWCISHSQIVMIRTKLWSRCYWGMFALSFDITWQHGYSISVWAPSISSCACLQRTKHS